MALMGKDGGSTFDSLEGAGKRYTKTRWCGVPVPCRKHSASWAFVCVIDYHEVDSVWVTVGTEKYGLNSRMRYHSGRELKVERT